jgi:quinol monooxygenase YgiN
MIVVNAKMTTNEENFKIIKKAVEKLEIETRKEKGCIDYGFSVELHNNSIIRITELWEDLKSLKDHLKTKHIEIFLSEIALGDPPKTDAHFFEATSIPYPDGELPKEVQG